MREISETTSDGGKWRYVRIFLVGGLICISLMTLFLGWFGFSTRDATGRLFGIGLGGIGAAFALPFWAFLARKAAFWLVLIVISTALLGMMEANAWACRMSGTEQTQFYNHWYLLLFSLPGLLVILWEKRWQP